MKSARRTGVRLSLLGALAAAALTGRAGGAQIDEPAAAIKAATERLREAVRRGEVSTMAEMYTEDAQLAMPGATLRGRDEIRSHIFSVIHQVGDFRGEDVELFAGGDAAVETGRTVIFDRAGKQLAVYRYMTLWKKSDGRWRIHRDVSAPVAGASGR